ncbi:hypothetical protein LJ739_02795 [Aestuariibacter halophilus]|uniref:Uncharacterized protein n=1 Tax=Fluctibacter halophilus TaxID=226011 RepID=A0ABS8G4X6_9ALTE|nr:hypothetical protein [Aestuariibacter halophilus]MCC2615171.1 hypothetical protein [Aestuariibacter halophilus]
MIVALIIASLSSLFFYVQAFRNAMPAKKWALAGFLCGPFLLPMFGISQQVRLRQSIGFQNGYLRA